MNRDFEQFLWRKEHENEVVIHTTPTSIEKAQFDTDVAFSVQVVVLTSSFLYEYLHPRSNNFSTSSCITTRITKKRAHDIGFFFIVIFHLAPGE